MRSKVDFVTLDGDDSANDQLETKYGIRGYPTLIFTDNSGKVLENNHGYGTAESFKQEIARFVK